MAGLVRLSLHEDNMEQAFILAEEIWPHLDGRSGRGWFAPARVYLTVYEAFMAAADGRAEQVLTAVTHLLQRQAELIPDLDVRHAFWHNIPAHKQVGHLSGLWESYQ